MKRIWERGVALAALCAGALAAGGAFAASPEPLLKAGSPVQWWFAYKFFSHDLPSHAGDQPNTCAFGGEIQGGAFSQRYVVFSKGDEAFKEGPGLIGKSDDDPLGATFGAIWNSDVYYVAWNDQFYGSPQLDRTACALVVSTDPKKRKPNNCMAPFGHSKGMLAWGPAGDGVVIQVTTPDWPGSASKSHPRAKSQFDEGAGNTLGCVVDNNVKYGQHFFALKLSAGDVKTVLKGLDRASVVTETHAPQAVNTKAGGVMLDHDTQQLVDALEKKTASKVSEPLDVTLDSGVRLLAKPSNFNAPPWQFVSWRLGAEDLRVATWNGPGPIPSTYDEKPVSCWPTAYQEGGATPHLGRVESAKTGTWLTAAAPLGLLAQQNHGKFGVSYKEGGRLSIFGDLNQAGSLAGSCGKGQNGRGGLFFVVDNAKLATAVRGLLKGDFVEYVGTKP